MQIFRLYLLVLYVVCTQNFLKPSDVPLESLSQATHIHTPLYSNKHFKKSPMGVYMYSSLCSYVLFLKWSLKGQFMMTYPDNFEDIFKL